MNRFKPIQRYVGMCTDFEASKMMEVRKGSSTEQEPETVRAERPTSAIQVAVAPQSSHFSTTTTLFQVAGHSTLSCDIPTTTHSTSSPQLLPSHSRSTVFLISLINTPSAFQKSEIERTILASYALRVFFVQSSQYNSGHTQPMENVVFPLRSVLQELA